jgi:para-nitrobenzyl esterase
MLYRFSGYYHGTTIEKNHCQGADCMKKDEVRSTPERVSCIGACIIVLLCVLMGCSSSDSGHRYGIFVDSAVEGITFKTETMSGETDVHGRFTYVPGETVTFSIGGIVLGTTTVKPVITPVDLVTGAQDENDPAVTNITRFLITLDEDNNPDNGITISPELNAALAGISVNFNQDPFLFAQDAEILEVMKIENKLYNTDDSQERTICSVQDAQDHLGNTIDALVKNGYEKPGGSGGNGGSGGSGSGGGGCG